MAKNRKSKTTTSNNKLNRSILDTSSKEEAKIKKVKATPFTRKSAKITVVNSNPLDLSLLYARALINKSTAAITVTIATRTSKPSIVSHSLIKNT